MEKNSQEAGNHSTNIQSGRDTNISNIMVLPMEQIVEMVKSSVFPQLSEVAKKIAEEKVNSYLEDIAKSTVLEGKSVSDFAEGIDTPDFQYIARRSVITATRLTSEEIRKTMATMLVHRLKSVDDLKTIALNEAIESINRLTVNHLKILSLIFISRAIIFRDVVSWESMTKHLNERVSKFIDFNKANSAQFEYLNYTGHAVVSQFGWSFEDSFQNIYTFLFAKPISKEIIDTLQSRTVISDLLIAEKDNEGKDVYRFSSKNLIDLKQALHERGIVEGSMQENEIISAYNSSLIQGGEAIQLFIEKTGGKDGIGNRVLESVKGSLINRTSLTLIGNLTAISTIETQCGEKINHDDWINA